MLRNYKNKIAGVVNLAKGIEPSDGIEVVKVPFLNVIGDNTKRSTTPARCNRFSKKIWINESHFYKFPPEQRLVILLHEKGHIVHNTSDEHKADEYALRESVKLGYPLSNAVTTLCQGLSESETDQKRIKNMLAVAKDIDKINTMPNPYTFADENYVGAENAPDNDNFFLFRNKAQKAAAQARKDARNQATIDRKAARVDGNAKAREIKAIARYTLAQQGTNTFNRVGGVAEKYLDTLGNIAQVAAPIAAGFLNPAGAATSGLGNLFGGGGGNTNQNGGNGYVSTPPKDNTPLIIGIVVGVVVLVGVLIFALKKK